VAIGRPRGKNGARPVYVHDSRVGRKVYVGSRTKLNGPDGAKALEAEKKLEFQQLAREEQGQTLEPQNVKTCRQYAERWFEKKHGLGTKRPAPYTLKINRSRLKPFLKTFGDRTIDGGIERDEALDFGLEHPRAASAAAAMFNDAFDEKKTKGNPFANRRQTQSKGRKNINPVTEGEVDRLCEIAREKWQAYGPTCAAWIMFAAWVGARPGEIANLEWDDLDFDAGDVRIRRIKPPYNEDVVVLADRAAEATQGLDRRHDLVFTTVQGKKLQKGAFRYYFDPVRTALLAEMDPRRKIELLGDRPDIDLYELRHFCGSIMADRGADEFEIAHQLGNTPLVCRETYIHGYRDRINERNRGYLNANVADLEAHRKKRTG
jgi:integrase